MAGIGIFEILIILAILCMMAAVVVGFLFGIVFRRK